MTMSEMLLAFGFNGSFAALAWKADEAFTTDFRKWLAKKFQGLAQSDPGGKLLPVLVGGILDHAYGRDAYSFKFISRAIATSILSVGLFFGLYVSFNPQFGASLLDDPFQRRQVAEQLIWTTLLVNCLTDYLCLCYCREVVWQMESDTRGRPALYFLMKDLAMKTLIFAGSTAVVYTTFASTKQSFGGSDLAALRAVPETLLGALSFQNMSSAYVYAAIISSFWLWGYLLSWQILKLTTRVPRFVKGLAWVFPLEERPIRSFGLLVSLFAMVVYLLQLSIRETLGSLLA